MVLPMAFVGVLIGLAIAKAKSDLGPEVSTASRSAVKAVIHGGLVLLEAVQELAAEGAEQLSDIVAEVQYERMASTTPDTERQTETH